MAEKTGRQTQRFCFSLIPCIAVHLSGCQTASPGLRRTFPLKERQRKADAALTISFQEGVLRHPHLARCVSWDPSGDWKRTSSATAFAPMLLYALARDTGEGELRSMAERTVAYEAGLVKRLYYWPFPSTSLVMGFPALAQPSIQNDDQTYRSLFLRGVRFGYAFTSLSPEFFTPFVREKACVYGLMGYMCLVGAEVADEPREKDEFVRKGVKLIEKANKFCWDEREALYTHSSLLDWPQETMMMALIQAYRATGNRAYLDRARIVLDTMNRLCRDACRGGYYGHPDLDTKGLSGNNNMAWVLLDLHEATGDGKYLEEAHAVMEWVLSNDLYDSSKGIIYHH